MFEDKIKRKITFIILLLAIIAVLTSSCSPLAKVNYHYSQIDKILLKHPEIKNHLDTTVFDRDEIFNIDTLIIDNQITNLYDTVKYDSLLAEYIKVTEKERYYSEFEGQIQPVKLSSMVDNPSDAQNLYEKRIKLRDKKIQLLEQLYKGAEKDTIIVLTDTLNIKGDSIDYEIPLMIRISKESNSYQVRLISLIDSLSIVNKDYQINVSKQITFWKWLKDNRTLSLLIIVLIFLVLILFRR